MRTRGELTFSPKAREVGLPQRYLDYGLVRTGFKCLIDEDILEDIAAIIESGWTPINSCSGTKSNHRSAVGIAPYLTLWLANGEEDEFVHGIVGDGFEVYDEGGRVVSFLIRPMSTLDCEILNTYRSLTKKLLKYRGSREAFALQSELTSSR